MPEFDPVQKSVTEQIFRSDRSRRLPTLLRSQFWEQPFTNRIFLFFAQGSNLTRRGMIGGLATGVGAATVISSGTRRVSDGFGKQGHKATAFTYRVGRPLAYPGQGYQLDTHILDIFNLVEWEDLTDVRLVAWSTLAFQHQARWNASEIVSRILAPSDDTV